MTEQELGRLLPQVFHADLIGKHELAVRQIGLRQREQGAYGHPDAIGQAFVSVRHWTIIQVPAS